MKQPYLKKYRVSWRVPKYGVQNEIVLAKSADAARNLIKKDYGTPKYKQVVSLILVHRP